MHRLEDQTHLAVSHHRLTNVFHTKRVRPKRHLFVAQLQSRASKALPLSTAHSLRQAAWLLLP